jgi:hypothetical protein
LEEWRKARVQQEAQRERAAAEVVRKAKTFYFVKEEI